MYTIILTLLLVSLPPNAFVEPDNPEAVFPRNPKPDIKDFRSHKLELGGYAAVGTFRKTYQKNAKVS